MKNLRTAITSSLLCAMALGQSALANDYPDRAVTIVVPYTAGGPADLLIRAMGESLSKTWGEPVIVDNKPGANEVIAAQAVARSKPDGYTWLVASDSIFSLNQHLYSKLPYDPIKDFEPVTKLVTANLMLVTRKDFPANNVKEWVQYIKQNPGKVNYGSVGVGGVNHLGMAWISEQEQLQMQHVPYKGLAQGLQDIVSGRLDTMFAVIGGAVPFLNSDRLKAIAVSGDQRSEIAPNVPTFTEQGYPKFDASFYFAIAAPKGTPAPIIDKFARDASVVVQDANFQKRFLRELGFVGVGDTPQTFAEFLVTDRAEAAAKVKASGAKLD
ncbi:MAG TPA: tripartite tricarboxylate transporter substrate binding protein [Bordetella sp.]|nr:tripartite tricarboxylate transporter substrate binding protein [Bordetella sp.]